MHQYQVRLYDTSYNLKAIFDNWSTCVIEHQVNRASTLQFAIPDNDTRTALFVVDAFIEVWRRNAEAGIDWYAEYGGFVRTTQHVLSNEGRRIFNVWARGYIDLLKRRSIRYYADTSGSTKTGPAETVMKEFVEENAGPSATVANGRKTDGVTDGLTVQADGALGSDWTGARAWRNLLEVLQEITESVNDIDFDVVKTGATSFEFRTYSPQLGTDRREGVAADPLTLAVELGNMTNVYVTTPRTDEITSVLVLGEGEGVDRVTTEVQGASLGDSPWNLIEVDRDARTEETVDGLTAVGNQVVADSAPRIQFAFDIVETPSTVYGRDFVLGDLLTARYGSTTVGVKVEKVNLNVAQGRETIKFEFEQLP